SWSSPKPCTAKVGRFHSARAAGARARATRNGTRTTVVRFGMAVPEPGGPARGPPGDPSSLERVPKPEVDLVAFAYDREAVLHRLLVGQCSRFAADRGEAVDRHVHGLEATEEEVHADRAREVLREAVGDARQRRARVGAAVVDERH